MTFRRQASIFEVPLKRPPSIEVTDDNKVDFLRRNLEHQLVRTIEKQAAAFREGVEEITGVAGFSPLRWRAQGGLGRPRHRRRPPGHVREHTETGRRLDE